MLGLQIFVRVQNFRRRPFVPSHNFCHPGSHLCLGESIYEWLETRLWFYIFVFPTIFNHLFVCQNMLFLNVKGGNDIWFRFGDWKFKLKIQVICQTKKWFKGKNLECDHKREKGDISCNRFFKPLLFSK